MGTPPNSSPLDFSGTGQTATVSVSQTNYGGAFTPSTDNGAVATIAAGGSPGQFTVTSQGGGTAHVTISGGGAQSITYTVNVAVTTITPSSKKRHR